MPEPAINDSRPIVPYHVRNPAVFGNPLFTEEALFAWAFQRWVLLLKYLQEIEVAYQ